MDTNYIHTELAHETAKFETEGPSLAGKWLMSIIGILILLGLYLFSLYNYLLFHTVVEMSIIMVFWAVFIIAWNCRRIMDNNYLLFLGIAYLFVGGLELVHVLAYKGMPIFYGYDADPATKLWIAARYMESLSLLVASLFLHRRLKTGLLLMIYTLVTLLVLGSVFSWHIFPACFVEGVGLTPFKKISEYLISIILIVAIYILFKNRKEFDEGVFRLIVASIVITIAAELAFTFYISVYGLSNLAGHYLKLVAAYLIYKAIIKTGLTKPYSLLFRNLKQSEKMARESEEKFRIMMETLKDLVYICSADFRVEYMNPAMIRRTGRDATGENCSKALHDLNEKCSWCVHDKVQQGESLESDLISPKDNRSYHNSQSPIAYGDGSISKMTVFRDTTDQKLAEQQIKSALKEKEVLLSEVHHRVKNNMQIIISLLRLQAGKIEDKQHIDILKDAENRVRSMALIHEKLYQSKDFANIDFNGYAKSIANDLIRNYAVTPDKIRLKMKIEDILLGLDHATPCGLILNELISNSLKYAFPKGGGEIKIALRPINDDEIELAVSDDGVGIPEGIDIGKTESLGLQLVQLLAENQLDGEVDLDRDGGTAFRIRFRK